MTELILKVVDYCHWQTKENDEGELKRLCAYCSTEVFFEDTVVHFSYRILEPKIISSFFFIDKLVIFDISFVL